MAAHWIVIVTFAVVFVVAACVAGVAYLWRSPDERRSCGVVCAKRHGLGVRDERVADRLARLSPYETRRHHRQTKGAADKQETSDGRGAYNIAVYDPSSEHEGVDWTSAYLDSHFVDLTAVPPVTSSNGDTNDVLESLVHEVLYCGAIPVIKNPPSKRMKALADILPIQIGTPTDWKKAYARLHFKVEELEPLRPEFWDGHEIISDSSTPTAFQKRRDLWASRTSSNPRRVQNGGFLVQKWGALPFL